eukprot:303214_1
MSDNQTCKEEEEMVSILQNTLINEMNDDEEATMITNKEISGNKKHQKYLAFCIVIAFCLVVLVIVAIIGGGVLEKNTNNKFSNAKSKDLVNIIMEDPVHCLVDENCTSFTFNNSEILKIKQTFNRYDGNDDDLWTKQEFMSFFIESSANGGDVFNYMDFNNDDILSYKEAVIYFMMVSEMSLIKDVAYPVFQKSVEEIYGYNTTNYNDQLFWEYVVELMFVSFDIYQQGFIKKEEYLTNLAESEFNIFAKENTDSITFDEFFHSRFNQQDLDKFVNTDIDSMSAEFQDLAISLNNTQTHIVLSEFKLQHCLYSDIDFEIVRRLIATRSDCYWAVAGCVGAAGATIAGCILGTMSASTGVGFALAWTACGGGSIAAATACRSGWVICEEWINNP